MIFCRNNKTAGNEIVKEIRQMAKEGVVEITKDDCISLKAKVAKGKRLHFSIQMNGIIIEGKEICLGNYYKNIKVKAEDTIIGSDGKEIKIRGITADKIEYMDLHLDKTSLDFTRLEINYDNDLSFELAG